jgi:hypothetical protein
MGPTDAHAWDSPHSVAEATAQIGLDHSRRRAGMSEFGPSRTSRNVPFCAAVGGEADIADL